MNAIEVTGLSKIYHGKRRTRVNALQNLSLSVEPGEVFGFLGPNGAGKSTTIKILMGLIPATTGVAKILGEPTTGRNARGRIGFLPENPAFYDYLTAEEYLRFVGSCFSMKESDIVKESERVLRLLELWDARKRPSRSFSKGMVQRLGLAQALLHDPDVFIFDEPMSGLDPIGRVLVKDIILDLKRRGKSIFFSTHITSDVEAVCDRVGVILHGQLKSVERVRDVLAEGMVGYIAHLVHTNDINSKDNNQLEVNKMFVSKDELAVKLQIWESEGLEVRLLEPQRRSLEDYFLEIVKGNSK